MNISFAIKNSANGRIFPAWEKDVSAKEMLKSIFVQKSDLLNFFHWVRLSAHRLVKPLRSPESSLKIQKLFYRLYKEKIEGNHDFGILFTSMGSMASKQKPEYSVLPTSELNDKGTVCINGIYYTQEAYEAFKNQESYVLNSKEDVDWLLTLMLECDLISWTATKDGCYLRADISGQILRHLGIDPSKIFKQYVCGNFKYEKYKWNYHVAIGIEMADGEVRILDPSIDPASSLTRQEWIDSFKKRETEIIEKKDKDNIDFSKISVFRAKLDQMQKNDSFRRRKIALKPTYSIVREFYLVAAARYKLKEVFELYPEIYQTIELSINHGKEIEDEEDEALVLSHRAFWKGRQFREDPEDHLLLTKEDILAFSPTYHDLKEKHEMRLILLFYREFIKEIDLKEKTRETLIKTITTKLREINDLLP